MRPLDVVTGGSGFLGSHLVERLARAGRRVVSYDLAPPPPDLDCDPSAVRHVTGDIRDPTALRRLVTDEVDTVYHLSAMVGVDRYLRSPLDVIDVNLLGTRAVLQRALEVGARVVVASTSEVYGRNPAVPWAEDADRVLGSTATDRWSYSTSKALAEHLTLAFARELGLRTTVLRYFNVYGPRQRPAYVVSGTVHRLLRGLPPLLYDGGAQTRAFTYVDDAVTGTLLAAAHPAADGEVFNIGSDRETTVAELVRLAGELAGVDTPPLPVDTDRALGGRYEDIPRRVPDVGKARRLLSFRCATPLPEGLRRTIEWARRSPWWTDSPVADAGART
ncbi:NAD-dependent epimerase/dehydratase family protein [Micromonospora olivasterospora]|uniref:UDP-glucose 4-epimerase n=1 Tax=Micromonospora olivasterospora TaxID=1880 RepID=A0A562I255_MICOL|nr:NAD-dependent epimerase/dehydratase family protein [Micromonospora olivasterospora]TWH65119.1 UDP-glucose 4-epimerase [Micromonospora olivasterospora]